jgi:2-oxoisovalerate dehydrogenase E2 component (dihydrolipoyl transacylase)
MTLKTFNLPDVGEGLTEAEIVQWRVQQGATVAVNDIICEIETAKSLVELSSPYAGTVSELLVPEGETIEVGTPIIAVDERGPAGTPDAGRDGGRSAQSGDRDSGHTTSAGALRDETADDVVPVAGGTVDASAERAAGRSREQGTRQATPESVPGPLVGTGPKADAVKRRPRKQPTVTGVDSPAEDASGTTTVMTRDAGQSTPQSYGPIGTAAAKLLPATTEEGPSAAPSADRPGLQAEQPAAPDDDGPTTRPHPLAPLNQLINRVLAKPPVRKAARDLGINLADVPATGTAGEVTKQDLISYQSQRDAEQDGADSFWSSRKLLGGGRIERIPVKGVRKATAKAMVQSAFTAPHVSIFVDVDASRTMELVKRLKTSRDFEGIRVSPLLILAKAVIWAAARNPSVNATWGDEEILVKHFMNLGIAAATPRGLMVPNIKDAQNLSLKELAIALNDLATTARAGKTQPAQMQGGTLTITNIGALGIDTGTPIINPGEVAIVAFGTIKQKPWVLDGEVIPRWITTLGGSFDHRVVDGDLGARFMADVASILEEPALLLD